MRSPYDEMIIARGDLEDLRDRVKEAEDKVKLLEDLLYKANRYSAHTIECTLKPNPWDTPCNCWKSEVSRLIG